MGNEITNLARINIVEGALLMLGAFFFDTIAPIISMHHSPSLGSFQILIMGYGLIKVLWGMYLCKQWSD